MTQETKLTRARAKKYSLDLSRYYRKPSTQVSLSIVLSLLIVTFFLLVALKPTFVTIAKLNKEIEQSEDTLGQLIAKTEALNQASRVWESIQPAIPYVETSIPQDGADYTKMTKSIEVIVRESGVSMTSLTLGESLLYSQTLKVFDGKDQEVVTMPITMRVVGDFSQILSFLQAILKLDRLIELESLTINREVKGTDSTVVGLAVNGNVQYLANKKMLDKAINVGGR